ncbi:hypothetical protein [Aureispira anguillae]|uniref:Lipoprotein n=1 Tax=Aureispira anguillae TaxID=2864201 RepID=A0A916DTP8_9BACT|nr:hypothetical protein [Aureispira anguillae]BDS11995.1 hypothetical protein AsAng_0027100 [Aureispira anguillae]
MKIILFSLLACGLLFTACEPSPPITPNNDAKLIFKLKFDSTQTRLNALAQTAPMPAGHAGQHPKFNGMSAHKIELVPNSLTPVNAGPVVYHGPETNAGGDNAIKFNEAIIKKEGETFYEVPLKDIAAGTYEYIRVSVSYQNYDVYYDINNVPTWPSGTINLPNQKGTIASFVGFNTYINSITPKNITKSVNANKLQGYWAFETDLSSPYNSANAIYTGAAPGTTVVNPISSTAPTPSGSCLVTGTFDGNALEITGNETEDIIVTLSFSTNKSFEWVDSNGNGKLDIDVSTGTTETVVDMGLRGLKASYQ